MGIAGTALSGPAALAAGLLAIWAALAVVTLSMGGLTIDMHEGDALHMAAIVLRMAEGEWPHLDFMTPIGVGAMAPIAGFVSAGAGVGHAFLLSQAAIAAALLPALWWVGVTRLGGGRLALGFGALAITLCMALVYGGADTDVSVSMHYNRWAWAIAWILLAALLVPADRSAPRLDGAMIGAGLGALALIKITYFAAVAPVALLALVLRRQGRALGWAAATGLGVAGVVTALAGPGFWPAYLGDLAAVAASETRPRPGLRLAGILGAPTHLAATLTLLGAVVVLRRTGRETEGLILLAAAPGLVLITWQNFGNDPQWLPLLAVALLALRPLDRGAQAYLSVALVAGALALPSTVNLASSISRLERVAPETSVPLLTGRPVHADLRVKTERQETVLQREPSPRFAPDVAPTFWGTELPACQMVAGGTRVLATMADEVAAAGFAGRAALLADQIQPIWLMGDLGRLEGGAPWYYGGLPGLASAEIVVVPLCPLRTAARKEVIDALAASGTRVREAFRGRHAIVLEIVRG
ncbi:hypothetical protein [Rhodovulum sp. 12E13]|uniref:hypothetical protein n=1 Tax=Rhodovulum sp. 12E13 TaxID=2203891 RepID=UPI0011C01DDD|nr:hypothetical protein [Rhodovulum sp. 12E13]